MALSNATLDSKKRLRTFNGYGFSQEFNLSGLTSGATVTLPHNGPAGTAADFVEFMPTTRPTDGSSFSMSSVGTDTTDNELDRDWETERLN